MWRWHRALDPHARSSQRLWHRSKGLGLGEVPSSIPIPPSMVFGWGGVTWRSLNSLNLSLGPEKWVKRKAGD